MTSACDVMSLNCHVTDGRDDSGNSSSSSSTSVTESLEKLSSSPVACETTSSRSVWLPDYSVWQCGYELDTGSDVLLPLHKTVCCALCRSVHHSHLIYRHIFVLSFCKLIVSKPQRTPVLELLATATSFLL